MNKRLITAIVAVAAVTTQLFATEGVNLIGIGPIQQGTAGAGVASAKDSTWLILNPAGLTDVEMGIDASLQYFAPVRTLGTMEDDSAFVIPSISSSFGCCHGENGYIGLGLYGTSGMGVDYAAGMTELSVAKMTATYAYKFGDSGLSVGAGPIFVLSRFKTDILGPYSDWDTAYGAGAIIGINQTLGRFTLGGSYMTEQYMTEFEDYVALPESMNLPQQLTVGAAYNVLDNVELVLDYRWTGWKELALLGDVFGWSNQNIVKAGITWGVNDALTLRGGISHGESPIDETSSPLNAFFPAIVETHLSFGASYAWEKWAVHGAYTHALENEIEAFGISMYQNSLTAGVTYTF